MDRGGDSPVGVLLGNLQLYVMEILMRLLSLAALDYRLTPTLKSCALFVNESTRCDSRDLTRTCCNLSHM